MTPQPGSEVSAREAEVLALIGERATNAEIARRLFLSVRTVESHVSSLLRKYGVPDRRALAALAARAGDAGPVDGFSGLPVPRTSFVGRRHERAAVAAGLADTRLMTLVGMGGVGKSRLAVEVVAEFAPRFPGGGAFVDLVPVREEFVPQAAAAVLGVRPNSRQRLLDAIVERLGDQRCLLVIDNCEHLLDAVARFVERVLTGCPGVTILATSRERLSVPGERVMPVLPLAPESDGRILFQERAVAADPGFAGHHAEVEELCARLDGLPLAIELAAARTASLGTSGLLSVLDEPLRLLSGRRDADERHRSLRTVLGWSYGLLDEAEQALFRRLAVFAGGFDLDMVMRVAAAGGGAETADLLGRLVDKSLVVHQRETGRWQLLGTVRAFARELLDGDDARTDVLARYLSWAASVTSELVGRLSDDWRATFDTVVDDLRAALLNGPSGIGGNAHRLARALGHLTYARRFFADSLRYYRQAAERAPTPSEAARDLRSAADCGFAGTAAGPDILNLLLTAADRAGEGGDGNARGIALARAVELVNRMDGRIASGLTHDQLSALLDEARAAGDPADPAFTAALDIAEAWNRSGRRFDPDPALARIAVASTRATNDPVLVSAGLDLLSTTFALAGRADEERRISQERLALLPLLDRNDPRAAPEIGDVFQSAATTAMRAGDLLSALAVARQMGEDELLGKRSYHSIGTLVPTLLLVGEVDEALRNAHTLWENWRRAGCAPVGEVLGAVAFAALGCALKGDGASLARWRARIPETTGDADIDAFRLGSVAFVESRIAVHLGELGAARERIERCFADDLVTYRYNIYACASGAELAVVAGMPDAAERISTAEARAAGNAWAQACLARARGRLHGDVDALAASVAGWERIGARVERACTLALMPGRESEARAALADLGVSVPDRDTLVRGAFRG